MRSLREAGLSVSICCSIRQDHYRVWSIFLAMLWNFMADE
jgi:hypothetical protein